MAQFLSGKILPQMVLLEIVIYDEFATEKDLFWVEFKETNQLA